MRKIICCTMLGLMVISLAGCGVFSRKCETEPIVAENHKLIVPPNFGQMPQ